MRHHHCQHLPPLLPRHATTTAGTSHYHCQHVPPLLSARATATATTCSHHCQDMLLPLPGRATTTVARCHYHRQSVTLSLPGRATTTGKTRYCHCIASMLLLLLLFQLTFAFLQVCPREHGKAVEDGRWFVKQWENDSSVSPIPTKAKTDPNSKGFFLGLCHNVPTLQTRRVESKSPVVGDALQPPTPPSSCHHSKRCAQSVTTTKPGPHTACLPNNSLALPAVTAARKKSS